MGTHLPRPVLKALRWMAVVGAVVIVVSGSVVPIMAQTVEPQPIAVGEPHPTDLTDQIMDVRRTYRGQLEQYRNQERQYTIALDQYQRLGTLTSLETAVTATQQLMKDRATVLSTYTNLLRLNVIQQTGLDPVKKQELVAQLDQTLVDLEIHQKSVELATDKIKINALTLEFKPLGKRVEDVCYKALSFLSLGKLQTVYDKAEVLHLTIKAQESSSSAALEKPQRDRAIAETERTFDQVETQLKVAADLAYSPDVTRAKSDHQRLKEEAGPVYSGLNKILSFLEEILRLF